MHTLLIAASLILIAAALAWVAYEIVKFVRVIRTPVQLPHANIELVYGDITEERVDVIVNAAKSSLLGGGGVDGAIHRAGGPAILRECQALRASAYPDGLPTGHAVATTAGRLPASWVVHTVGPDQRIGQDEPDLLFDCYVRSLKVAEGLGAKTIAFPLISSGVYGWPVESAIRIALAALRSTGTTVETARLVLFDEATLRLAETVAVH